MNDVVLQARSLTKTFGAGPTAVYAVRNVDLDVHRGEVVLLMGPSGSGKTTLLSMLGAMLRPSAGSILVDGVDLATLPERRLPVFRARTFGFVFQDFNLLSALNVRENVEFALNLNGVTGRVARTRAEAGLDRFGLGPRLGFQPADLSGGEKQRVAIARALANEPSVILADEPTANLDSRIGHDIAKLLRHTAREEGRSVVIVSHDTRLEEIADRVLWLEDGEIRSMSDMARDPVCSMAVSAQSPEHFVFEGTTYHFCSAGCREEFAAAPERFLDRAPALTGASTMDTAVIRKEESP
jgi:putative ABC transport system ATP-binding protein